MFFPLFVREVVLFTPSPPIFFCISQDFRATTPESFEQNGFTPELHHGEIIFKTIWKYFEAHEDDPQNVNMKDKFDNAAWKNQTWFNVGTASLLWSRIGQFCNSFVAKVRTFIGMCNHFNTLHHALPHNYIVHCHL